MLSILVCHSYFLRLDQKQWERAKPYPPLATLQVAALLRKAGHHVALFDSMLAEGVDDYAQALRAAEPQVVLLYEDTFNFLSKMCLGAMRSAACDMIAIARHSGMRVIVAGPDASDCPLPYLRAGAEVALVGEGLVALMELLPRLEAGLANAPAEWLSGVAGVTTLEDGRAVTARGSRVLPTSHDAGFAAWDLLDVERYRAVWLAAHGYFSLNMAASRGCSFRCAWCSKPTWGNQYLQRNATEVALEMAHLKRQFKPDHVWFADDIFGFRIEWIAEFERAVRAADGKVPFTIQTRADLISERMARALSDAGCRDAWIGAESGSQRVLDAMNKGTTVDEIETARRRLRSVGVKVGFFIQLGYLDERMEDIVATRELLDRTRPDEIGVSVSYPLPGTKFHDLVQAELGRKTRWQESNDLAMMFQGTYTSDFYRAVRNLLHDQVNLQHSESDDEAGWQGRQQALDVRWRELLRHEAQFRSTSADAAAVG